MENVSPVKSVQKALALLDRIALGDVARQGVALSELAQACGLPQNTAHNLLKALAAGGYVAQQGRGVYVAGPKCAQIARVAQCADPAVQRQILTALQRFTEAEGEACVCTTLVDGARVTVAAVDSTHVVRVSRALIEDIPFFSITTGRMLAATATEEELRQILARQGWPDAHWNDITTADALKRELDGLRAQGWCRMDVLDQELVALACPVQEASGRTWGVLGAYAPAYRCPAERQQQLLDRLQTTAAAVAAIIAHP